MTKLMGGPPNVAAMMTNQIEVSAVLVTLEGLNADVKKPGVAMYIALNSQTKIWKMEQFVVRSGFKADTIADLKGAKTDVGAGAGQSQYRQGHSWQERPEKRATTHRPARHGPAHQRHDPPARFDGGYTLEPNASMMIKAGVARSLEAGVISKYILGDEAADAYAAGCAMTSDFIGKRPEVAKRFATAWGKAIDFINKKPRRGAQISREKTPFTPDNVVDMVSMLGYVMAGGMTPKQIGDLQKLADFGNSIGVVPEKLDVTKVPAEILKAHTSGRSPASCEDRIGGAKSTISSQRTAPHVTIRGLTKRFFRRHDL